MKSNIAKGAVISYLSIFINFIISFIYTPWMIRQIGVSDYGLYNLIISFVSYFLLDFGLDTAITRFIAKYRAEGDERKVENMLGLTTRVYLIIDIAILIVLLILYFFIEGIFKGLTPIELEKLKILYCIAGGFSILNFVLKPMNGAMMAYEYFVENKLLDMVTRVGTVLLIVVALIINANVYWLVLINGFTAFFVSIIKYFVLTHKSHININWRFFDSNEVKLLFTFSVWVFLISLAQRFRLSLVHTILGIFSNTTQIAIFSMGMVIEGFVWNLSYALNGLFLPKVSRLNQSNDKTGILALMVRVGRIQLFIIGFLLSCFLVLGRQFIELWVGQDFVNAYYVVLFLTCTNIVSLTQSIAGDLVYAEGKVNYTGKVTFITSFIGLVGSCLLAPRFGAVGCAACSGLAMFSYIIWANFFYKNKLDLDILFFFKQCHLKILPYLILLAVPFFGIFRIIQIDTWYQLFVSGFVYFVCYSILCYFLTNKDEKILVMSFITGMKNRI